MVVSLGRRSRSRSSLPCHGGTRFGPATSRKLIARATRCRCEGLRCRAAARSGSFSDPQPVPQHRLRRTLRGQGTGGRGEVLAVRRSIPRPRCAPACSVDCRKLSILSSACLITAALVRAHRGQGRESNGCGAGVVEPEAGPVRDHTIGVGGGQHHVGDGVEDRACDFVVVAHRGPRTPASTLGTLDPIIIVSVRCQAISEGEASQAARLSA